MMLFELELVWIFIKEKNEENKMHFAYCMKATMMLQ